MNLWLEFVGYFSDGLQWLASQYEFLGTHRWAAAIVTLTLIVRTLLLPLAIKQIRSMREQQRLQPELKRLREKFRNDRQKLTQETMELFRREGVNPYAACLPMIAQAPVFIAIFYVIRDLRPEGGMPLLGLADLTEAANSSIGGWLLIAMMTVSQLLATRQLNPGQTPQQRRLQLMLPFIFIFIFMGFPAALVLYWATQSMYQLVQQLIMTRGMPKQRLNLSALLPGRKAQRSKPAKRPVKAPPVPVPAASTNPPSSAIHDHDSRRVLAEKRRRRRRRKRKRKR